MADDNGMLAGLTGFFSKFGKRADERRKVAQAPGAEPGAEPDAEPTPAVFQGLEGSDNAKKAAAGMRKAFGG